MRRLKHHHFKTAQNAEPAANLRIGHLRFRAVQFSELFFR
jgi:hypothetical protein